MNPRQRRGLLLIIISVVGAVSVFVAVSGYVADVQTQVGDLQPTVRLLADVPAFTPIPLDSVEVVEVPERWRAPLAIENLDEVAGLVSGVDLPRGSTLEEGDLRPPPEITDGLRQIAILVDAETGVAGNIAVGDVVDIVATRVGFDNEPPRAEIAIEAARILSIGAPQPAPVGDAGDQIDPTVAGFADNDVVPVTFRLPTSDVLRLAYVESFATNVRLALRSPTDTQTLATAERIYAPESATAGGES